MMDVHRHHLPREKPVLADEMTFQDMIGYANPKEVEERLSENPPDLTPEEMFEVERESARIEMERLVSMGVFTQLNEGENGEFLTTKMVFNWRKRRLEEHG